MIFRHIDAPGYTNDLACYVRHGGYEMLKKAVAMPPAGIIDEVKKSGLRGRGGAGFPCGVKWGLVDRKSGKPIYLVVNADESEPGTFKDRYIIHQDPHQLIEGIMISSWANNVKQAYIYIRGEFPHGARVLETAIAEARAAGFELPIVSGGSTPTMWHSHQIEGMNEMRPGTYIFNDRNTVISGACTMADCAATILSTVVSTSVPGQFVIDGGSKTFSSDRAAAEGFGVFLDTPEALFEKMNEEHGYVKHAGHARKVGDRVRVLPNHVCVAVNLHEKIYGVRGDQVEAVFDVLGRGKLQ